MSTHRFVTGDARGVDRGVVATAAHVGGLA